MTWPVMQLAKDRGVDVYWFTWNAFLDGAEGKDGIGRDAGSPRAIEYLRDSVRETIKTYPLLAGFGITAGENMRENMGGMTKEQWLWKTYGEGIRDALKEQPQRKFRLIHRFHQTGLSDIQSAFTELPCPLDLSFKYAIAHMYSVPDPTMIKPVLPLLSPQLRSWLTVRNDDIFSFRWADLDYARAFIKAIPRGVDVKWFPEACRQKRGFYTVRQFIEGETMPGTGVLNIIEWRASYLTDKKFKGITPTEIAATLETNTCNALKTLPQLQRAAVTPASRAKEYAATLDDIEAMSYLGLYYGAKIRGACDLALFDKTGDLKDQASSVQHLDRLWITGGITLPPTPASMSSPCSMTAPAWSTFPGKPQMLSPMCKWRAIGKRARLMRPKSNAPARTQFLRSDLTGNRSITTATMADQNNLQ